MAKRTTSFVVRLDPSVKLSPRSRTELTAAIGGSAAAALARLDLRRTLAFVPRIDWPGGMIIDLRKVLPANKLNEILKTQLG